MKSRLVQLQQRIIQLETIADEVKILVEKYYKDDHSSDDELSLKGQRWFRGCRELLNQQKSESLTEFNQCYFGRGGDFNSVLSGGARGSVGMTFDEFQLIFRKARSIFRAVEEEILSRELPMATQLSFSIVADELDIAELLLTQGQGVEAMIRASGVIARVALERHLRTVVASRSLVIPTNRPNQLPVADILSTLVKANVITPVQRSQFDSLFSVANNCAHPNGPVVLEDVKRLLRQGRELAAVVL